MAGPINKHRGKTAGAALALHMLSCSASSTLAQSVWDPVISNTHWYVAVPHLIAFAAPFDNLAGPFPIGDQTLWTLGASVDGVFTGTSLATLAIGPIETTSESLIEGNVTPSGQITMIFTPTGEGPATIGLGVMRHVGGVTAMEMQMISGSGLWVTHWADMLPYDPNAFTPPPPQVVPTNLVQEWAWTEGTPWRIVSPEAFGTDQPGTFIITGYKSGYFWGQGIRPGGTSFTLLGSITPEGRVLFNTLENGTLLSLYGGISGDSSTAEMLLGTYDASALFTGDITHTYVVRPYEEAVEVTDTRSARGAAKSLYAIAGSENGLMGTMAPVTRVLNDLSGPTLSAALSQTVPILAGAMPQAAANTHRLLGQVVFDRLYSAKDGHRNGLWMRPLYAGGEQSAEGGAPGYRHSGGGMVMGADTKAMPGATLGTVLGFASHTISADIDAASASFALGSANLKSYVLGLYGLYELAPGLDLTAQANGGWIDAKTSRFIGFMKSTAEAEYGSLAFQASAGLRKTVSLSDTFALLPAVRLDFLQVDADSYRESGASPLSLSVQAQSYRELFISSELAARYHLAKSLSISARGSVGYNILGASSHLTATFAGGGPSFVTTVPDASPWLFTAGAALTSAGTDDLSLDLQYDVQANASGYFGQAWSIRFNMRL